MVEMCCFFHLHPNTFHRLFQLSTQPQLDKLKSLIAKFNGFENSFNCQIKSLYQFQSFIKRLDSYIDCDIEQLNKNIDDLLNFNSFVTKCVKSYLCKYIASISKHYSSSYNSLKQNIKTFESIQKCVKTMRSLLNGSGGSERYVKSVFSNMSGSRVSNAFSYINNNYPSRTIRIIDVYLTYIDKFLDESNPIDTTTTQLGDIKDYMSHFSWYIGNYNTRIRSFLIPPLSSLVTSESNISKINNGGIKDKYEKIKHKVDYCKSSLEFEVQRLESISNNAKMLQKQLESLIEIIKKYKSNMEKLNEFKRKLESLKKNKDTNIKYLTRVATSIVTNLSKIQCISNSLKCRKERVIITTIKTDIEHINSSIKDINNILSVVTSHLESLVGINLGIDCKLLNEIECCIKEIVCLIHGKYCCSSSDVSGIFFGQPNSVSTSGGSCQLSEILKCTSTTPTCPSEQKGPQTCGTCQDCQSDQGCQCCLKNCEALQQLVDSTKSCTEPDIEEKLKCIKKVISQLIDGKSYQTTSSCPTTQDQQCPQVCQTGQGQPNNTCQATSQGDHTTNTCLDKNVGQLIKCSLDEIKQFQSSLVNCESKEEVKCPDTGNETCQITTEEELVKACSPSTSPGRINCYEFSKLKLFVDTLINKCNCTQLRQMLNNGKIKLFVDVFKCLIITNFRELFCLYIGFDKSILDYISFSIDKLEEMKLYLTVITFIHSEIKFLIDCIKDGISEFAKQFGCLENTMRSGIREMECAIEGVDRNLIRCSLLSLGKHVINRDNYNNLNIYITNKNNLINNINDKHYMCN